MRPSLALSVARILLRVPTLPSPAPKAKRTPEYQSRVGSGRRGSSGMRQRVSLPPEEAERQMLVNAMTNWQRTQWGRAGYPKSMKKIRRFCALERRQ